MGAAVPASNTFPLTNQSALFFQIGLSKPRTKVAVTWLNTSAMNKQKQKQEQGLPSKSKTSSLAVNSMYLLTKGSMQMQSSILQSNQSLDKSMASLKGTR